MLNVARDTLSLARGGVLCRPGQTGERAVWGVSDPPPETHRRPQPRPRGSLTPHVSQHVSQRFWRRRSTHLCGETTDAITMAAARACDVRSGRRSRTPRRRLLQRVHGRIVSRSSHGLRNATSTGFGIGSRGANLPAITCDSMALCSAPSKALRSAPPPRSAGLRALTAPVRSARTGSYVMADDPAGLLVSHIVWDDIVWDAS